MAVYYNEIDPFAAAWLRELIKAGEIADGVVDERSIVDVRSDDLRGFTQCHFFAGIGGWSLALRLAGWPDDRPVWTGSCPCQPFSAAGQGRGKDDPRHLWPQFRRLIRQCRPPAVFGEQVASAAGRVWLSAVFADLEALAYRAAGADLCGPSVGAYDIRQRLWFVADSLRATGQWRARSVSRAQASIGGAGELYGYQPDRPSDGGEVGELADALPAGRPARWPVAGHGQTARGGGAGLVADAERERGRGRQSRREDAADVGVAGQVGFWDDAEWIPCTDGKWRPTKPGLFPLAARVSGRVGQLRGAGNSIKPQVAAAFIESYCEAIGA